MKMLFLSAVNRDKTLNISITAVQNVMFFLVVVCYYDILSIDELPYLDNISCRYAGKIFQNYSV